MRRLRALAIVTVLGALGGAIVSLAGWFLFVALTADTIGPASLLGVIAWVGAIWGAVLGPALGFGLLRRVPLWRAVAGTALGALAAIALCALVAPDLAILAAPVGMLLAALVLRRRAAARSAVS